MVSETGAVCDFITERGPRCGVDVAGPTFRLLAVWLAVEGMSDAGASGASAFLVDQKPTEWSAEAERTRFEGWWIARDSMLPLCP